MHGASGERLREPGVLLECDGGWLLLDTGFNTALIRDACAAVAGSPRPGERRCCRTGRAAAGRVAAAGVDLADIRAVAVSHLH